MKDNSYIRSMYPSLELGSLRQVELCIKIGLFCVDMDPNKRPTASKIIDMLDEKGDSISSYRPNSICNVVENWMSMLPWHCL